MKGFNRESEVKIVSNTPTQANGTAVGSEYKQLINSGAEHDQL